MAALIAVVVAVAVTSSVLFTRSRSSTPAGPVRPAGVPANIPVSLATLMSLIPLNNPSSPAPDFTLTDQAGRTISLSSLRGKVVVLEFMDPHCTDICPIVSQEFVDAYHNLGPAANKVVFAAVNVNQYHASVADMAAYSSAHGLTAIPSWHFLTGPVPALRTVWRQYGIEVHAPSPSADVVHTSAVYFIDPRGRTAYMASPMVDHTKSGASFLPFSQIADWGRGITLVARDLGA